MNLAYPTDEFWHWTENEDGSLLMVKDSDGTEMPLYMLDENFICFGSMDDDGNAFGGYIIFGRDAEVVWTPDMLAQIDASTGTAASVGVSVAMDACMEIKYICTSADMEGMTLQPSMLGGEYSLTLHADGTVDFVMVGTPINGLSWTLNGDSILIDYYGTLMAAIGALIVLGVLRGQFKQAKTQSAATNYVRKDSSKLDIQYDHFLYEETKQCKIETQKSKE